MIRLSRDLLEAFWWISTRALSVYCIIFGVAVIIGGEQRMPDPTYSAMKEWADPWVWGAFLVAAALMAWFGKGRVCIIGCALSAFWFGCYGVAFLLAFFMSEISPFTASMTYFFIAFCWILKARIVHERRTGNDNDMQEMQSTG